jgi:hypothetical protein
MKVFQALPNFRLAPRKRGWSLETLPIRGATIAFLMGRATQYPWTAAFKMMLQFSNLNPLGRQPKKWWTCSARPRLILQKWLLPSSDIRLTLTIRWTALRKVLHRNQTLILLTLSSYSTMKIKGGSTRLIFTMAYKESESRQPQQTLCISLKNMTGMRQGDLNTQISVILWFPWRPKVPKFSAKDSPKAQSLISHRRQSTFSRYFGKLISGMSSNLTSWDTA